MNEIAAQIADLIATAKPRLMKLDREAVGIRPAALAWSTKEVLGHLIDSAANNHQRFVRAASNRALDFPPYDQNAWVETQRYREAPWEELVELWERYNRHLCHVIARLDERAAQNPCHIGKDQPVPLEFVVKDYLRHLRHHLDRILGGRP